MSNRGLLEYRAGPAARRLIRKHGLSSSVIRAFVAPASGPKWLVLAGLDGALMESGLLCGSNNGTDRTLLIGSSAGGWRVMALAATDPKRAHSRLLEGYVNQVFPRGVRPAEVTEAYRGMLGDIFAGEERKAIVESSKFDIAVHVARAIGWVGSRHRWIQALAMVAAAAGNFVNPRSMGLFFGRTLFHTRPQSWSPPFDGTVATLNQRNFLDVALATGSVPLYFRPVTNIEGVQPGAFIDGGMRDYHLNQRCLEGPDSLVLFPHFQRRIVPNWFDRYVERRTPSEGVIDNVLQVYPSEAFVRSLPGGRIPTRDDFKLFVDEPEERIRRWRQVVAASEHLGAQLIDDLGKGRIPDLVESHEA